MKHLLSVIALILCTYVSFGQTPVKVSEVPPAVLKSYHSANSNGAKDSLWTKHVVSTYCVNYMDEGKPYQAWYMEDGSWIKTITEIPATQLSAEVHTQIAHMYPEYVVSKALIELNSSGKFYTVDLVKGKDKATAHFLMSGKHVK